MEGKGIVGLIGNDADTEVGLKVESSTIGIGNRLVPDLIKSIRGIGDKLSKENLLVRIEGVDDQTHQLLDIGFEGKMFSHFLVCCEVGGMKKKD